MATSDRLIKIEVEKIFDSYFLQLLADFSIITNLKENNEIFPNSIACARIKRVTPRPLIYPHITVFVI